MAPSKCFVELCLLSVLANHGDSKLVKSIDDSQLFELEVVSMGVEVLLR